MDDDVFFDATEYLVPETQHNAVTRHTFNSNAVALEQPKSTTSLLDLPPVIRNKIGRYALLTKTCEYHSACKDTFHDPTVQPAITRVCRTLRAELLLYFYRKTDICLLYNIAKRSPSWVFWDHSGSMCGYLDSNKFARWLEAIGSVNRRAIGSLRVHNNNSVRREYLIDMLQKEWLVEFTLGKRESCCWDGETPGRLRGDSAGDNTASLLRDGLARF